MPTSQGVWGLYKCKVLHNILGLRIQGVGFRGLTEKNDGKSNARANRKGSRRGVYVDTDYFRKQP